MRPIFLVAALALATTGFAQTKPLAPVTLPPDAKVSLEIDARDGDLLAAIKQFLGVDATTPATGKKAPQRVSIPSMPSVNLDLTDISAVLRNVHQVKVVTYTAKSGDDPVKFHEALFAQEGMHRMIYSGGDENEDAFLVMRGDGTGGLGIVFWRTTDEVTVVRTDGMIDMGLVGRLGRTFLMAAMMQKAAPTTTPAIKKAPAPVKPATKTPKSTTKKKG